MIAKEISVDSFQEAQDLLLHLHDADKTSTTQGLHNWDRAGIGYVHGIISAELKWREEGRREYYVVLKSGAISEESTLNEYLPERYR